MPCRLQESVRLIRNSNYPIIYTHDKMFVSIIDQELAIDITTLLYC